MKPQTESMLRNAMSMDPEISPDMAEDAINALKGNNKFQRPDSVMKRKDVMRLLHVHRRTLDYYLEKGYLEKIYGGGKRAIGISRESFIRFTRRRTPQQ